MNSISTKRFSLALACVFALVYVGCAFVMATVPRDTAIRFFNSITHGVDWTPVLRWDMPAWEMVAGTFEVFILGWLIGAAFAAIYNLGAEAQG